ncbi:MAG: oligoendopeptidase F [Candidatus Hydrogenedentes bacterium]|nr:oligoendopeptidase F [Candidatus Hydrogenedentota bacterium]
MNIDTTTLPGRHEVPAEHRWDLTPLFASDEAWQTGFSSFLKRLPEIGRWRGKLGRNAQTLRTCLDTLFALYRDLDRFATYAHLRYSEDQGAESGLNLLQRAIAVQSELAAVTSYITPELMAIRPDRMTAMLADPCLEPYREFLEKTLRFRPHTLGDREEHLLALQSRPAEMISQIFDQLVDVNLDFGEITDEKGQSVKLTHGNYRGFLESSRRSVRKAAFRAYYNQFEAHAHTLASILAASVSQDCFMARCRNYGSCLEMALFPDNVPVKVYEQLTKSIRSGLPALHRYHRLRATLLKLPQLEPWDLYVPAVKAPIARRSMPYEEAVDLICRAVQPLGEEYVRMLRQGLTTERWVDRYENRGKASGAFSSGCYDSPPYILMNYRDRVLDSVFTLAHEAGHSMHSWLSRQAQPYHQSHYTIFVAEVASTVNELLLNHYLMERERHPLNRAFLISREIDEIRGTIFRQTMFAEFEKVIHEQAERDEPLTLQYFTTVYEQLLQDYFGDTTRIDPQLRYECLRIPHFYRAFYVYKYATGLSAAIAIARAILSGDRKARDRYLAFLSSGGKGYPLDQLREAGVDLSGRKTIQSAMTRFAGLVDELERCVKNGRER